METTILSQKNCHRAATVREIGKPDAPELEFKFRAHEVSRNLLRSQRAHLAGDTIIPDTDNDMCQWEVTAWKYAENFDDMWDLAVRAYDGTSFEPEERARYYIHSYEEQLQDDLKVIPDEERGQYVHTFREWVRILFTRHSRILSPMITGPARFPTAKNNRANNAYESAVNEFDGWRERAIKAINRRMEDAKPEEQKKAEEWARVKREIKDTADTIRKIDNGEERGYIRALLVSSLYGKLERMALHGKTELIQKATEYVRELNAELPKPLFTARHKFWKLQEVAEASIVKENEKRGTENAEMAFDSGTLVKNFAEDRLQILFDAKPDADTIAKLKKNGFRWSPRFKAWQRQLTQNAYYACARVIPVTVEQIKEF